MYEYWIVTEKENVQKPESHAENAEIENDGRVRNLCFKLR